MSFRLTHMHRTYTENGTGPVDVGGCLLKSGNSINSLSLTLKMVTWQPEILKFDLRHVRKSICFQFYG